MAALSRYLEEELLKHIFLDTTFDKPTSICIGLTSDVPKDNNTGTDIPEIPTGIPAGNLVRSTGYSRIELNSATSIGSENWYDVGVDDNTIYQVNDARGYFYPLYLKQATADAIIQTQGLNGNVKTLNFDAFPGVDFYSPSAQLQSGVADNAGYLDYEGHGFVKNKKQIFFSPALSDWGWVSGVAVFDAKTDGNMLFYSALKNPRQIFTSDTLKFDLKSIEISLS